MGIYLFDHYLPWWVLVVGALVVTVVNRACCAARVLDQSQAAAA